MCSIFARNVITFTLIVVGIYIPVLMYILPPSLFVTSFHVYPPAIFSQWKKVQGQCHGPKAALETCGDDEEACGRAYIAMQTCVASVVCPSIAQAFTQCLERDSASEADMEAAFTAVQDCTNDFELSTRARLTHQQLYK